MQVSNQKPAELSPVYNAKTAGPFDPMKYVKQTAVTPLLTPLVPSAPASITDKGNPVTEDEIAQHVINCCSAVYSAADEDWCKELFGKTLVYYDKSTTMNIASLFVVQAATKEKMPFPSTNVVYTPSTDVIPEAKKFLAGQSTYEKFFATLAFYKRLDTLGFYFANSVAFNEFKAWFNTMASQMAPTLPADTNQLVHDFVQDIQLNGLTESLKVRNNDGENNHDGSFARLLVNMLMLYATTVSSAECGVLPFSLGELYCPKTVVFVNVDAHAHATAKEVKDEWDIIDKSLSINIPMISNKQLSKLTAVYRNLAKIQAMAANALSNTNVPARAANVRFRKKEPSGVDILKMIRKIMGKMATVAKSENSYKSVKMTFQKPNRRDPDDFNKQGKSVSTKYKPDLHVYIDTSGSISEENYEDAIKVCIMLARKLNVNLYFNSFSDCMSQCTKLNTKDKTARQVYVQFQRIPKVTGGTDYEQIWHYINRSKKRRRELSLIITDFEWTAPNRYVEHPKNLYYLPCSHMDWKRMCRYADGFCKSMMNIDPNIRAHVLA